MLRRFFSRAGVVVLAAVLAACSGSGGGSGSGSTIGGSTGTGGSAASSDDSWNTGGVTFDESLAQQLLTSPEFRFSDADCADVGCGVTVTGSQSAAYALHNVHLAHSAGLSGAGQLVAVVDEGFRLTHQEFSGKTIHQTGALPQATHGTFVASLIAGIKDGVGMHGIAPGADLHLTSLSPTGLGFDIDNVIAGTLSAASLGAVAQNNSWGFEIEADDVEAYLVANPGATTAQALASTIGLSSTDWQTYINALDTFQQGGVVVFALSNNETILSGDILAALPYFESSLSEAWIAAANGYFEVDGSGNITKAVRLSAACGMAARFCLAGDGIVTGATATTDSSYAMGYGTSFVAPQVAASVALLAEAFPDLTPEEWAKRLLASADNSWFSAEGVATSGTVDFGNGVTHAFSDEWGHGVLDLQAALSPIGTVAVLNGTTVTTAARHDLVGSVVLTPTSFGDSLTVALAGREMAVFDALNRSFSMQSNLIVQPGEVTILPRLLDDGGEHAALYDGQGLEVHYTRNLGGLVNGFSGLAGQSSALSLAGESMLVSATGSNGAATVSAYGFASEHDALAGGGVAGGGVVLAVPAGLGVASLGVGVMSEDGGVLGLEGNSAFDFGAQATLATVNIGIEQQLTQELGVFGRFEYGAAAAGTPGGLVASVDGLRFSGIEVGAVLSGVLTGNDRLTFSLAQPMRLDSGSIAFDMPVGRSADGTIRSEAVEADLRSSGREIDIGLGYALEFDNRATLDLGVQYAIDAGHVAGATVFGAVVGYRQTF